MISIRAEHAPLVQPAITGLRTHYAATNLDDQVLRSTKKAAKKELHDVHVDRPSIRFQPSWTDFTARSERLAKRRVGLPMPELPLGFPREITGARVWSGRDIEILDDFIIELSSEEITEIEVALVYFQSKCSRTCTQLFSRLIVSLFRSSWKRGACSSVQRFISPTNPRSSLGERVARLACWSWTSNTSRT